MILKSVMPGRRSKMCDEWMPSDIPEYIDQDAEAMRDAHQESQSLDTNTTYDGLSRDEFVARHGFDMVAFAKAKIGTRVVNTRPRFDIAKLIREREELDDEAVELAKKFITGTCSFWHLMSAGDDLLMEMRRNAREQHQLAHS